MPDRAGTLIVIGGHEDREGDRRILRAVAERLEGRPLLILTTASRRPEKYIAMYQEAFAGIGVNDVRPLALRELGEASDPAVLDAISASGGVFITGGSQARLLDAVRNTPAHAGLRDLCRSGGVIAGTSAGASVLGGTVLSGTDEVKLFPGLGFVPYVVIDQHFSQRDRLARLTDGLARAAGHMGIGIDEDTALLIDGHDATVIGTGTVTVLADEEPPHTLVAGDHLALPNRAPMR